MFTAEDFQFVTDNMNRAAASFQSLVQALEKAQRRINELERELAIRQSYLMDDHTHEGKPHNA